MSPQRFEADVIHGPGATVAKVRITIDTGQYRTLETVATGAAKVHPKDQDIECPAVGGTLALARALEAAAADLRRQSQSQLSLVMLERRNPSKLGSREMNNPVESVLFGDTPPLTAHPHIVYTAPGGS
jgi:hypothetical protein